MKFKIPDSLKSIFIKKNTKEKDNQPSKILDVKLLDQIVSELSVFRQLKEGSLKYDKDKDKYVNAEGRKVRKKDVFKSTFVEKPNVTSTTTAVLEKTKELAPAGLGILGILFLLSSPQVRGFIGSFLKETLLGKDGLLPEPIKKFVGWFIDSDDETSPVVQSKKFSESLDNVTDLADKANDDIGKLEGEVQKGSDKLQEKADEAGKITNEKEEEPDKNEQDKTQPKELPSVPTQQEKKKGSLKSQPEDNKPTPLTTAEGKPITSGTPGVTWNKQPEKAATPESKPSITTKGGGRALGEMSAKYESGNKGSEAVGWDSTGGTSYGKYQIASKTGTLRRFLEFLKTKSPELYERLAAAGDPNPPERQNGRFAQEWKKIAMEGKWGTVEHDFIQATHYDVGMKGIKNPELKKMIESTFGLQEVMWSSAVQHGGGGAAALFNSVYTSGMSPAELIKAFYKKRGTKFSNSTEAVQKSVLRRFEDEEKRSLALLDQNNPPVPSSGTAMAAAPSSGAQVAQQSADVNSEKKKQDANKNVSTRTIVAASSNMNVVPCKDEGIKGTIAKCAA